MDLASLDSLKDNQEAGAALEIKNPISGDPIGITVRVASYDSDRVKKVQRSIANDRLRNSRRKPTVEEFERSSRDTAVSAVLSWTFADGVTLDGAVPDCTKETVERLFRRFPFMQSQVDEFASDLSNFAEAA